MGQLTLELNGAKHKINKYKEEECPPVRYDGRGGEGSENWLGEGGPPRARVCPQLSGVAAIWAAIAAVIPA